MSEKCVHNWYSRFVGLAGSEFFCMTCGKKLTITRMEDHATELEARIAELEALVERLIEAGDRLSDSLCTYPEEEKTIEVCNWNAIVAEYKECEK